MNATGEAGSPRCRYISSYDGVSRCSHEVFAQRFCRYHYRAYLERAITEEGHLVDTLSDQVRRRQINFHGIRPEGVLVGPGSKPTACEDEPSSRT